MTVGHWQGRGEKIVELRPASGSMASDFSGYYRVLAEMVDDLSVAGFATAQACRCGARASR